MLLSDHEQPARVNEAILYEQFASLLMHPTSMSVQQKCVFKEWVLLYCRFVALTMQLISNGVKY